MALSGRRRASGREEGKHRFSPFLRQSHNFLIHAYLDPAAFTRFAVKDGDLAWDDYDLCFPIAV